MGLFILFYFYFLESALRIRGHVLYLAQITLRITWVNPGAAFRTMSVSPAIASLYVHVSHQAASSLNPRDIILAGVFSNPS